jgi:acetyl-CoA acyltransferase
MSGARISSTAALDPRETGGRYAFASICIGVGQGIAIALERIL